MQGASTVAATQRDARSRVLPDSLGGQVVLLLVTTIVLSNACFFIWYSSNRYTASIEMFKEQLFYRAMQVVSLVHDAPPELHQRILSSATTQHATFTLDRVNAVGPEDHERHKIYADNTYARLLAGRLGRQGQEVLVYVKEQTGVWGLIASAFDNSRSMMPDICISIRLVDGRWLNILQTREQAVAAPPSYTLLVQLLITATACAFALVMVGQVTGPLRSLADSANRLGRGEVGKFLTVRGPGEIRAAIKAYNRMEKRIRTFVQDRRSILAAIAHDLRAPLTLLRLRAETVHQPGTKQALLRTLDSIEAMIEELLNFSQFELVEGRRSLVLVKDLVNGIRREFEEQGHEMELALTSEASISCDVNGLARALRNLIQNAIKYGGGRPRVQVEEDASFVFVSIEDSGPGIPCGLDPDTLFQPLYRVDTPDANRVGGTGLGMGIARSIVRAHGGDVTAGNLQTGHGFRVIIRLPRIDLEPDNGSRLTLPLTLQSRDSVKRQQS